jgi:tetratricopeptide (TPR) repeat protein
MKILQRDSTDFRSWAAKAYLYQDEEKDSMALACFKRSYAISPVQVVGEEIAFILAQNKSADCIPFCNLIISRDSAKVSVQPFYCKGLYYKNTGNTAEAIKLFDYCMKTDYTFPDPFLDKGEILYNQKKYDEAIKIFQLVKNNNNTYADAYFWVGKCYEAQGKKKEAALEYERTLALDKDFKEAKEGMRRVMN